MKKYSYIYMLLYSAALFVGCSKDDEGVMETQNDFITITANAPVVQNDGGSTRVDFKDNNGLEMKWESTDKIRIRAYNIVDAIWGYGSDTGRPGGDKKSGYASGPTAGNPSSTASFTFGSFNNSPVAYTITIGKDAKGNEAGIEAHNWGGKALVAEQTQDCTSEKETSHLNENYTAILQNIIASSVTSGGTMTFSADWASANAYVPQATPATGEPASSDCGVFMQSSCLKMPLTLPALPKGAYNNITKMVITTSRETTESGSSTQSFYSNNRGGGVTNTITLNFSNVPNSSSLTAYFMLASAGLRVYNTDGDATKWNIKIYYINNSSTEDYIYKDIKFTTAIDGNNAAGKQGKLYKVTVGNTGWKDSSDQTIN